MLACFMAFMMSSCYSLTHQVGNGAQGGTEVAKKQWYALWGLVAINDVDSHQMAGGAEDYTIKTEHTFIDLIISAVTGFVSIQVKTVEVTK